jgi:hypothetical protein
MIRDFNKASDADYLAQEILGKLRGMKDSLKKEEQSCNDIFQDNIKKSIDELLGFVVPNPKENNSNEETANQDVKFEKMSSDPGYAPSIYFGSADSKDNDSFCIIASGAIEEIKSVSIFDRKISISFSLHDMNNSNYYDNYVQKNNVFLVKSITYSFDVIVPYDISKEGVIVYFSGNKITVVAPRMIALPEGAKRFIPSLK